MFQQGKFDAVDSAKESLKQQLEAQRQLLSNAEHEDDELYQENFKLINESILEIHKRLQEIRLEGGEFEVRHRNERKLLEISEDGRIVLCNIITTSVPQIPSNMSSIPYFRVGPAEFDVNNDEFGSSNEKLYTIVYASEKNVYCLEDVKSLIVNDSGELPCLNIILKDKKKILLYSDDIEEVSELLVAKLKHFTANKLLQIGKLKKLWNLKQISYDSNNSTHENMLMKFWNSLFPDISIERISSDWSKIGFQGKDPSTDFRGGGVLSLYCLQYFVDNFNTDVNNIVHGNRDYPFAVAGINVANELVSNFLKMNTELLQHSPNSAKWNSPLLTFFSFVNADNAFYIVFSLFFLLLDSIWIAENATYMQFPDIMARTKKQFTSLLQRRPLSIEQLNAWVQQEILMLQK